jgi:hypothetical protein
VLREQRQRFAFGALAAGMVVVAALNVLNPDAFIVRANLAGQRDFDTGYAIGLSPDATPTIAANLARIPADDRCGLMNDLAKIDGGDWRTWNLSRERARKVADTGENCDPGR